MIHPKFKKIAAGLLAVSLLLSNSICAKADDRADRIAEHQAMPIQSNEIAGWPAGPVVSAESAILIEADSGTILYSKNIHQHEYPASTTKILTALLAYENSSMNETVTFSHDDVFKTPRNSNHIAMNPGDSLTMEQCLNALLIRSANEVAYAIAAHVGGSWDKFAEMMNDRARELGAVDSNFVNPNGLPDENHVTSAYDLAMIGRAFFSCETLCKITMTPKLIIPKKKEDLIEWNQMALIPTGKYAYEYLVGCKTGYTDSAHSALVSCAEKNGLRLICVVLNDENPEHNEDTIALFEYGFGNFEKINVSQKETKYDIDHIGFFYNNTDIFGTGQPILSLNKEDCVILPKSASFSDLKSDITYDGLEAGQAALITYTFHNVPVGTVSVNLASHDQNYTFEREEPSASPDAQDNSKLQKTKEEKKAPSFIFISPVLIKSILAVLAAGAVLFAIFCYLRRNFQFSFGGVLRSSRFNSAHRQSSLRNPRHDHRAQIREAKRRARRRSSRKFNRKG
ncbi:MAG: D-alanyl-D-alanine carboxypeptidase [Lachnospiraceae bacterium]|nr:D-alanyl-D-alanine carboxypeptidase [Lachnospiraceae bacterium]